MAVTPKTYGGKRVELKAKKPSITLMAIDPGDAHTGVAIWKHGELVGLEVDSPAMPATLEAALTQGHKIDEVIIEKFELFPSDAANFAYQPMQTSELIGALRWICKKRGLDAVMQPPGIKKGTLRQCVARQINYKHRSIHAQDAMLHAVYYLLRNEYPIGKTRKRSKA